VKKVPEGEDRIDAIELYGCQLIDKPISGLKREVQLPTREEVTGEFDIAEKIPIDERTVVEENQPHELALPNHAREKIESGTMLGWIQEEAESREEAALEGVVSEWKIRRINGQSYSFHFLIALRKWIMEERVTSGDKVITGGGAEYLVEAYPGTADLFDNIKVMKQRRHQVVSKRRRQQKFRVTLRHVVKRRFEMAGAALVLVICMVAAGRFGWQQVKHQQVVSQAKSYLQKISDESNASSPDLSMEAIEQLVWENDSAHVNEAVKALSPKLGLVRRDPKAVCLLTEALIRRGILEGSVSDLGNASNLIAFMGRRGSVKFEKELWNCHRRAQGLFFFSQGMMESAENTLTKYKMVEEDPFALLLLAKVSIERQDYQRAKRYLAQTIELTARSTFFVMQLSEVLAIENKWQEAIAVLLDAIDREPQNPQLLARLARYYEQSGDFLEAERMYLAGMQVSDKPDKFQYLLVSLYNSNDRHKETIKAAGSYLSAYPRGEHFLNVQKFSDRAQSELIIKQELEEKVEIRRGGRTSSKARRRVWSRR
jgi:predicted negative regulator of RcsB-dependent stress response